ncbi:MAG: D-cysteine desulfhydrase [Marinicellaceae bacterium]
MMNKQFKYNNTMPKVKIAHLPTQLEFLNNMSKFLGCNLYIKRDDCTGLAGGGNKVRKLEYLLADAQNHGADTLITIGGLQSNHARQTAAVASKYTMDCELVLEHVFGTPKINYCTSGNILLNRLFGAKIHQLEINEDSNAYAQSLIQKLIDDGKKPYFIPVGGSNVIGSMGYVDCAYELLKQIKQQNLQIDQIVLATGSAGTQAGLLAGLIAAESNLSVLGICVSKNTQEQNALVESLLRKILKFMHLNPNLANGRVFCNGNYFGSGYGISNDSMISAVKNCAQLEGLLLDPVYTGKAMAGLVDLCHKNIIPKNSNQIFLHTGGSPALFAYGEIF